jgi:hypothetical protein
MHRNPLLPFLGAALLLPAAPAQHTDTDTWAQHRAIRVLYAGWPDGSREKAFEPFLKQWFDTVSVIDLKNLSVQAAADYDVVIADWCSQYGNDGYPKREDALFSAPASFGPEFQKPIIAMDYVSSHIRSGYKLDWL